MGRILSDLLGTLSNTLRVNKATLSATGLTAPRAYALPDTAGTLALTSDFAPYLTSAAAALAYEPKITAGTTGKFWRGDKNFSSILLGNILLGPTVSAFTYTDDPSTALSIYPEANTYDGMPNGSAWGVYTYQKLHANVTQAYYGYSSGIGLDDADGIPGKTLGGLFNYIASGFYAAPGQGCLTQTGFYFAAPNAEATNNYAFYSSMTGQPARAGGGNHTITNIACTTGVVTVTTSAAHGYIVGQRITIQPTTNKILGASARVITAVPSTTTFSYATQDFSYYNTPDVASVADTGSVLPCGSYNLYMEGNAPNFFAGALIVGIDYHPGISVSVDRNISGADRAIGIASNGLVQSDVITSAVLFESYSGTQAANFTLPELSHFYASQGYFGAGSTVTQQYGFVASNTLIGATNNYGFYGDIAAGTNRWNLYMSGTAANFMQGPLTLAVAPVFTDQSGTRTALGVPAGSGTSTGINTGDQVFTSLEISSGRENAAATSLYPGQVVAISNGKWIKGTSTTGPSSEVVGFMIEPTPVVVGGFGRAQTGGILSLLASQWDLVQTYTGGLVPETPYYADISGKISPVPPALGSGLMMARVGYALNATELMIEIEPSIQL